MKLFFISLLIGAAIGLIVALILKGQLKSVSQQQDADNYQNKDSLHLTVRQDLFLYENVTKTPIPKNEKK